MIRRLFNRSSKVDPMRETRLRHIPQKNHLVRQIGDLAAPSFVLQLLSLYDMMYAEKAKANNQCLKERSWVSAEQRADPGEQYLCLVIYSLVLLTCNHILQLPGVKDNRSMMRRPGQRGEMEQAIA
ncbi:hypothetical protein MGYG_01488 [Nannizzia gypsea CBS 118893]|uniref:Uncharacterized protein n=1 Tax=Arthroderma gypseum (strain ATCC MYA-4604 / CBS 118893) TaxID=535722 RepID=E5R171_ARTGP|nr:hypothetical protein MGYG_01488 [Nannizzia gypsea CBS 118893]EFQ98460.1 hypothetical protein MGYG_01488 [Nannizzia gypsea CBS 118893]